MARDFSYLGSTTSILFLQLHNENASCRMLVLQRYDCFEYHTKKRNPSIVSSARFPIIFFRFFPFRTNAKEKKKAIAAVGKDLKEYEEVLCL